MSNVRVDLKATLIFSDKDSTKVLRQYKVNTVSDVSSDKYEDTKTSLIEDFENLTSVVNHLEVML